MIDAERCYNHINGCTNANNVFKDNPTSNYTSFCSDECWKQYNNVQDALPLKKRKKVEEWIQIFKDRSKGIVA